MYQCVCFGLGDRHQWSGEAGFGFVLHSVEVVDCSFNWRRLPVFLQTQRQTQSNGRHLQQIRIFVIHSLVWMTTRNFFKSYLSLSIYLLTKHYKNYIIIQTICISVISLCTFQFNYRHKLLNSRKTKTKTLMLTWNLMFLMFSSTCKIFLLHKL